MPDLERIKKNKLLPIKEAAELLGLTANQLRNAPESYIKPFMTPGGHRRYKLFDILTLLGEPLDD